MLSKLEIFDSNSTLIKLLSAHPEREHFEILVKNLARPNPFLTINQET